MSKCENRLWSKFKASCKHRRIQNDLTKEDYLKLIKKQCQFCGAAESNEIAYGGESMKYNGIDRLDSSLGYTVLNVVTCCRFCNGLKGSMPAEYWLSFLNDVFRVMSWRGYYELKGDYEDLTEERKSKTFKSRF